MRRVTSVILLLALSLIVGCDKCFTSEAEGTNGYSVKHVCSWVETNGWDVCISNYKLGLHTTPDGYCTLRAYAGSVCCVTNISAGWSQAYFVPYECNKPHLTDYPKSNVVYTGIQSVHIYSDKSVINGETIERRLKRYDYPTKKITQITAYTLVIKTNNITLKENTHNPEACPRCGTLYNVTTNCPKCKPCTECK